MDNVNKTLAVHSLVTLALCYLPGVLAAWLQLARGTKYSRFPCWLDNWLKMRKQLGLLMLFAASIHVRGTLDAVLIITTLDLMIRFNLTSRCCRRVCQWPTCPPPTTTWCTETQFR